VDGHPDHKSKTLDDDDFSMKIFSLSTLWTQAWSMVLSEMSALEVSGIVSSKTHNIRLTAYRATTIVSRVRLLAALFAVLSPIWLAVDLLALGFDAARDLVPVRLLSAVAFGAIVLSLRKMHALRDAYRALFLFLTVVGAVFLYAGVHSAELHFKGMPVASAMGYTYLPFLVLASMAIFPLTLFEGIAFSVPAILVPLGFPLLTQPAVDPAHAAATFFVMLFVAAVALLAGISQLALMLVLSREALHDPLTRCVSRPGGEELLEMVYTATSRGNIPIALAYISIDRLANINAVFGYETGNVALTKAAELLHDQLRAGDALIRWSGTDFVLVMPNAEVAQAHSAVNRLLSGGLGVCPDKQPVTASIGVTERIRDGAMDWWQLIDIANTRARQASQSGGNCTVDQ
jgi:diguanylate cyclase (GGDEF)-like protein